MVAMGPDDHERMVEFELRWYSLGGGPATEIRDVFGVDEADFFRELDVALKSLPPRGLPLGVVEDMKRVVRRRLWLVA
ncbi:hypothetical protein [Aldersonia kunmingensis]|uniref:hypothetical protein n=1 Tax=Aldersonia kunmingensis TaxID=408066 RepID=UPI000AB1C013|nr:hypothetical protein [Aldersonia kunmingensis]